MIIIRFLRFLSGYLNITVEGFFPERFLNICARRGIYLWDIRRIGKTKLTANISIPGFKLLPGVAYKSKNRIYINERRGLPFLMQRYRKRWMLPGGVVLFFALLYSMTLFLWDIRISGNVNMTTEEILSALAEVNLKRGVLISGIDEKSLQRQMMINHEGIAWIGIDLRGTTAYVEVREGLPQPEVEDLDLPGNVVSEKAAIIESIMVTNGIALVKKGDTVQAGEILITGLLDSEVTGVRMVRAKGEVMGRVWYEASLPLPQYEEIRTPTGNKKSKNQLNLFGLRLPLYFSDKVPYAEYDRSSEVRSLSFGKDYTLPLAVHLDRYEEVTVTKRELSHEEITQNLQKMLDKQVSGRLLLNRTVEKTEDTITVIYECVESIAKEVDI